MARLPIHIFPLSFRSVPAVYVTGLNFRSHAEEVGLSSAVGKHPIFAMKNPSSVVTSSRRIPAAKVSRFGSDLKNHVAIHVPKFLQQPLEVDYEGELAVIIGKRCKDVSRHEVESVIDGITCAVDVTARRWQGKKGGNQWCFSKSFDTFCPLGPELARLDHIEDINKLTITTTLNGNIVQYDRFENMLFDVPDLVSFLSQGTTLEPGTVILTGTPSGVGYTRKKQVKAESQPAEFISDPYYLQDGDEIEVEISHVGALKCIVHYD